MMNSTDYAETTDPLAEPAAPEARGAHASWLDRPVLARLDWETALYLAFIALAILTRFWDLGARVMSHDESLHTYFSYNLATGKGFQHTPMMHGPFLFHATALSYFLFGADDFTSRIPTALFGVALVALPFLFRRQLGRIGALATSFALLISPSILYHARYIRQEEFVLVWVVLTVLCVWRYLTTRRAGWLIGLAVVLGFHATDKSTSFLTVAWLAAFLAPLALAGIYAMRRRAADAGMAVLYGAVLGTALLAACILMEVAAGALSRALQLGDVVTQVEPLVVNIGSQLLIFGGLIVAAGLLVTAALTTLLRLVFGRWLDTIASQVPAFNLLVVLVTTTLFMSAPAMLLILHPLWRLATGQSLIAVSLLGEMGNLSTNTSVITTMLSLTLAAGAVSLAIGLSWNWRRWLPIAAVFGAITVTLFTTIFTNIAGLGTGVVGQLGYWMAQQEVMRGGQPWYYYLLIVPMYEYLVLAGALCALATLAILGVRRLFAPRPPSAAPADAPAGADPGAPPDAVPPMATADIAEMELAETDVAAPAATQALEWLWPVLLAWWMASAWLIYTYAGEKMPWLTVHIALPMAFLTGWWVDRLASPIAAAVRRAADDVGSRRWRALGVAGLSVALVVLAVRNLSLVGGLDLQPGQLTEWIRWAGNFGLGLVLIAGAVFLLRRAGPGWAGRAVALTAFALGAILTARTAILVTYINYDYTKEFLFYAHGAPGTGLAVNQIQELSERVNGGNGIRVGYDSESSWPMSWYMRLFPNARFIGNDLPADYLDLDAILISDQNPNRSTVEPKLLENYTRFSYTLVWWPMQDYFDLTWERISYSLFNPQARAALWDIAFNRDFAAYARLFNKTSLTPDTWSPSHRFALYLRHDMASQVWSYRTGDAAAGTVGPPEARPVAAERLENPVGVAVAANGDQFVIDHQTNRVFRIDAAGVTQSSWGGLGGGDGKFSDPWGIAIGKDGAIYVADTFNHRIQKFDRDGNFLFAWGQPGVSNAPGTGRDTIFFGPRAIVLDSQDRLFVSDTGNKRVQVFDLDGNFLAQFGTEGSADGEFDEPVGVAVDAGNNIYVADTWNKRIQVFDADFAFARSWPVEAWQAMDPADLRSVDHKPFLAVEGGILYVSSPRTGQVLAYTTLGQPVDAPDITLPASAVPTGLTVRDGVLYATDANSAQILRFELQPDMR